MFSFWNFLYFSFRSKKYRFSLICTKANANSVIRRPFTDVCKISI